MITQLSLVVRHVAFAGPDYTLPVVTHRHVSVALTDQQMRRFAIGPNESIELVFLEHAAALDKPKETP